MSKDFKASQIRTSKIVVSGSQSSMPGMLIYSASDASNFEGDFQSDMLTNVGNDVFLFVSGAKNDRTGVTLFGGDIVVSGSIFTENLIAEVDMTTTGSTSISGSLFVSSSATVDGGFIVNNSKEEIETNAFTVFGNSQDVHLIQADPERSTVYILSGGAASSHNPKSSLDTAFFVSGSIDSLNGPRRGASVFGGDVYTSGSVVIAGTLKDAFGNPIVAAADGGDAVGWFSGSSAIHGDLGLQPNWISTSGSLAVSGALHVASTINHINDPNTLIAFADDNFFVTAGGTTQLSVRTAAVDVNSSGNDVDFTVGIRSGVVPNDPVGVKVDASTGQVLILSGGAKSSIVDESSSQDISFYVSGSKGSSGTTVRGSALFGGDTVVSGALKVLDSTGTGGTISGSIHHTSDGSSFIEAGTNISVASSSNGQITISTSGVPDGSGDTNRVTFWSNADTLSSNSTFTFDGTTVTTPSLTVEDGLTVNASTLIIGDTISETSLRVRGAGSQEGPLIDVEDSNSDTKFAVITEDGHLSGSDVAFFVSGTIGSRGTLNKGTSLFSGDVAVSGSIYGTKRAGIENYTELNVVGDRVTFGGSPSNNIGNEVFFYVSGTAPLNAHSNPAHSLFDGPLVTSGNLSIIQGYPSTGSQLVISNLTDTSMYGGSVQFDLRAGSDSEDSRFTIQKYGPSNPVMAGGPYANVFQARSGSLVLMVGNAEDASKLGSQAFILRDMLGGTFFMATTGSVATGDELVYFMSGGAPTDNLVGADTNFVVSGSIGSNGRVGTNRGTSLFGGDLVVSGTMIAKSGLSGSLTRLADGSSYIEAGANITVATSSNGSITISSSGGGGGSSAFVSGSTTVSNVTSIDVSRLGILMDLGSNQIALTGTIGESEDGTYADGLFTTFDANTRIGHAIDKINEVLYYLAPSPAPNLSNIGNDGKAGTSPVLLSIGSTSTAGTSGYTIVGGSAGLGSAVDINESYQIASSSNNIRMGVFTTLQDITGDLADNVSQASYTNSVINYSGSAFGDANQGTLKLEINGSVVSGDPIVDLTSDSAGSGLPGSGAGTQLDGNNNGFFELSQTGSSTQSNGQDFGLFKYRTGKFRVATGGGYQRTGWNYARVIHTVGGTDRTTNYIEWFNDTSNSGNPTVENSEVGSIALSGSKHISGVEYATGSNGQYRVRIGKFYDNVYQQNSISFTTTNVDSVPNQTVPLLATTADSRLSGLHLTASFQIDSSEIAAGNLLNGRATFNTSVAHPTKTNLVNAGSSATPYYLLYSGSSKANNQFEDFIYEDKRLPSASYATQTDINTAVGVGYQSDLHLTSSEVAGYSDGLQFFGGKLKAPVNTVASGDFTSFDSLTSIQNGNQPDYSGLTSGTRTFFRAFKNESGAAARDFKLTITGSGTAIVDKDTALNSSNIRVYVKNPEATGYLNLAQAFTPLHTLGSYQVLDYGGLNVGTFTNSVDSDGTSNFGSFGTGSVPSNGHIILKIEADAGWTGDLDGMDVIFPAFDPTSVSNAPGLDEIDVVSPSDFVSGKLSFGAGKAGGGPAGYINVTGSSASGGPYGVGTDVDYNGAYSADVSSGQNKRYGIKSASGGAAAITGILNNDVSANGNNYTADSFGNAHGGVLSLYVNASGSGVTPVHTLDLSTFSGAGGPGAGTGASVNANGSGFIEMSVPTPASSSTGLPLFDYHFRTGKFTVAASDQNAKGWNWAQVVHSFGGAYPDQVTTFVEWLNDDDGNAVDITAYQSGTFHANSYYYQSGVKYFDTSITPVATGTVKYRVADAYTNVYSSSPTALQLSTLTNCTAQGIFVTGSSVTDSGDIALSSNGTSLPDLTSTGDITADIHVTGTLTYTGGTSLPGDASPLDGFTTQNLRSTLTVDHPIDTNAVQAVDALKFLAYSGSSGTSNPHTSEKFTGEYFRMQSGSYSNQSASGSLRWNSTESLVGADAGHNTGLIIYGNDGSKGYLLSPKNSALPNSGDFKTFNDLSSPPDNVDYSSASGERHFFRTFKNNTASDQAVISLTVKGSANLVPRTGSGSGTLGANGNVHIFVKIPGKTGWLDVAKAADGTITDGGGALQGDRDATIDSSGATNEVTFSTAFIGGDPTSNGSGEHFCLAIHADSSWTGYISEISVTF